MTLHLRPGARFRSTIDGAEVVVVTGDDDLDLRCGGIPMVPPGSALGDGTTPAAGFEGGTLLGKRYATVDGKLELLCVKAGAGALSVGDELIPVKEAKPLPASD